MENFFTIFYEWGGVLRLGDVSDALYDYELYSDVGIWLLILTFLLVVIYYYVINSPRFHRWYHWLSVLVGGMILQFALGFFIPRLTLEDIVDGPDLAFTDYTSFGVLNALFAGFLFFVFSLVLKWGSRNVSRTPF